MAIFDFFRFFCPIWHIRGNRPLQKDATRHAVIFHYSMPHSDNFPKFEIFEIFRPHVCKISVFKSEFLMPTYQPTTITMRISINSTLFSLSIAICGGMRVHFMKESVRSQTFALLQDTTCCFLEDQRYGKSTFRGPLMGPGPGRTPSICSFSTETSKCGARGGRSGALAWVRIQPWCQKLQILGTRAAVMEPWAGSKSSPIQPWCRKLQILGTKDGTPSTCSTLVFSPIHGLVLIPGQQHVACYGKVS